jgi:hypothetical protein
MGWLTAIEDRWAPPGVVRYIAGALGGSAHPRKRRRVAGSGRTHWAPSHNWTDNKAR